MILPSLILQAATFVDGRRPSLLAREREARPARRTSTLTLATVRDRTGRARELVRLGWKHSVKRGLDLGLTLALAPVWLPLLVLLAAAIVLADGAPVLFAQERCGLRGRPFRVVKFRTMVVDAEDRLEALLRADPDARSEYEAYRKLRADPRVTPVGRFLRRTSLDELPQLWNVLRGDMSLVGPRPYLPRELAGGGSADEEILAVRPGLTGLWQVTGRNAASFAERLSIDRRYVRSRSVWLDLRLLARTIPAVLAGKGAC